MERIGERAVVIGGSVAGMLAACALAEAYERVTVIDRDALPDGVDGRRAVPQGRHAHALLPRGQICMEELLPGLVDELFAAGAARVEALEQMRFVVGGHELARGVRGAASLFASRPFIEGHVRRRVRALPAVEVVDGCDALGLTTAPGGGRVTGVRVLRRHDGSAEEALAADLVVAATGRDARVPAWLEAIGAPRPPEERLDVNVTYASRHLRLPAGALGGDGMVLIGATPQRPRTLFLFSQENGRWILSLGGYGPAQPPAGRPRRARGIRRDRRAARGGRGAGGGGVPRRRRPPSASPPAGAAATSGCATSPRACWCAATRSARSTPPTARG